MIKGRQKPRRTAPHGHWWSLSSPSSPASPGRRQSAMVSSKTSPPPSSTAPRSTEGWDVVSQVARYHDRSMMMTMIRVSSFSQVGGRGDGRADWGGRLEEADNGLLPVSCLPPLGMVILCCLCSWRGFFFFFFGGGGGALVGFRNSTYQFWKVEHAPLPCSAPKDLHCFASGDNRTNVLPGLTLHHTLWHRWEWFCCRILDDYDADDFG